MTAMDCRDLFGIIMPLVAGFCTAVGFWVGLYYAERERRR